MTKVKLSKNKQALLDYLGSDYKEASIDLEPCIYRDFGTHDFEISGGKLKGQQVIIFLWEKVDRFGVIETVTIPKGDFEQVKVELDKLITKYNLK